MPKLRGRSPLRAATRALIPAVTAVVALGTMAVASAPLGGAAGPGGGGNTISDGSDPSQPSLSLGAQWWPYSNAPGRLGAAPSAVAFDQVLDGRQTKKSVLVVSRNEDSSTAVLNNTVKVAQDNAMEFTDYSGIPKDFTFSSGVKRSDGTVMLVKFTPQAVPAPNRNGLRIAESTDLGATWTYVTAPIVEDKWKLDWYRTTRSTIELADGTLLQGVYAGGTVNGIGGNHTVLLQSTDRGRTWTQRSMVSVDGDSNEMALSRTSDGRLIAVTRSAEASGAPMKKMKQTYSTDNGLTWAPQKTFVPPPGLPAEGIMPELVLQTNGALVLTYGRPDNYIAVSWDGTGTTWNDGKLVYADYIRETQRGRIMGSSGNTSLIAGQANYSVNFGDICHNLWTCREYGQQNGAWARRIDAVTAGRGKLDLATGVKDGVMKITGTTVAADARFAEQRLAGAIDGSSEYRAAARFPARTQGSVTVELDRVYSLNKVGLMLDRGVANGAKVQMSLDGKAWGPPLVKQQSVDYSVRYHDIAPTKARYVRISGLDNNPFTALNELELYSSDTWTFENDAVNVTPRGTVDTLHAFTADTIMPGLNSQRRAIIVDMNPDARATMTFPVDPMPGFDMSFGYSGEGYGSGAIWELLGTDAAGNQVTAWRFHFRPAPAGAGFALSAWDGTAWKDVGTFPTFTPNYQWIGVELTASPTEATMTVHGKTLTTTVRESAATALTAFRPSTGLNVADQNMEHSFDNLRISPLAVPGS